MLAGGRVAVTTQNISIKKLRSLRNIDDVLGFLAGNLNWPIDAIDLDDAVFIYTPEELGISADQLPSPPVISQLRPLVNNQPWGIFFLEFAGPRLRITPLRRLLKKLVAARRATGSHSTWELENLLFIVTTDSGESVEFHFVAFRTDENNVAEVRSLPWRPSRSPNRYLERLAKELLPQLAWPESTNDPTVWTDVWQGAFALRHGEVIENADRLAERMATVATTLRNSVQDAMKKETKSGPFHQLLAAVESELVAGIDAAKFSDMCAQTLVYGTLTSRVTDPDGFGASPTLTVIPLANPFLAAFFEQVHDQVVALELADDGLEDLVADLRSTNVEAILDRFGDNAKGGDPVVHFYEEFLKRYDAKMRADAGAFYTPQPVVEFMVRVVDQVLKDSFGMADGLADRSTWSEVCRHLGIPVPTAINPDKSFLSLLDPATGTGTYLVEWLRRAESSFKVNNPHGDWSERLSTFVLPSMHAFELMLAPYAIAHLKVALEAHSQGLDGGSLAIYLADTLEHPAAQASFEIMTDPIAEEGRRATELKEYERFTVIMGNPPYDRESKTENDDGPRKGGVVRHGTAGTAPLIADYLKPLKDAGLAGKHARSLYNDYVYFWRWATWQATELPAGPGVVAFITARSFLDGVSFGGVRSHLRSSFDEIFIFDLGGDGLSSAREVDENVFDIRVPVTICVGVRKSTPRPTECRVRYHRIAGTRLQKFEALKSASLSTAYEVVNGVGLDSLVPGGGGNDEWISLDNLLPWSGRGIQFSRTWPVGPSKSVVSRRWRKLLEVRPKDRGELLSESRDAKTSETYRSFLTDGQLTPISRLKPGDAPDGVRQISYRSFDAQWAIADRRVVDMPRPSLWASFSDEQVMLITLTGSAFGPGPRAFSSPYVPDLNAFRGFGGGLAFPLWRDARHQVPNVTEGLIARLSEKLGGDIEATDLFAYVYGVLGTRAFGEIVSEKGLVESSPPRIPITSKRELFDEAATLGSRLIWLHTRGLRFGVGQGKMPKSKAIERDAVRSYPTDFSYSESDMELRVGDGVFARVSKEVWDYEVSGLKVVQSWLGYRMADRKGRKSSDLDEIRPERWTFSAELLELLAVVEATVDTEPQAKALLHEILAGSLLHADEFPRPKELERKPLKNLH